MLNQLSRIGDQLPRARHRMSSGTASVLIAPSARREPNSAALARAAERELYAEDERSGRALVSIHVEVTHPELDTHFDVVEAQVAEAQFVDTQAEAVPQYEPERRLALAEPDEPAAGTAFEVSPQLTSKAFVGYAAERAFGAYAAQRSFAGAQAANATRLLNVRA